MLAHVSARDAIGEAGMKAVRYAIELPQEARSLRAELTAKSVDIAPGGLPERTSEDTQRLSKRRT